MSQQNPRRNFIRRLILAASHLLTGYILCWTLFQPVLGDSFIPLRLGTYAAPWLMMSLLPLLGLALIERQPRLKYLILFLGFTFILRYHPTLLPQTPQVQAGANQTTLRLMSFNVHFANRDLKSIVNLIEKEKPDIIAFQELTWGVLAPDLKEALNQTYPYQELDPAGGVFSRYPLQAETGPETGGRAQKLILEIHGKHITLWNLHLPTLHYWQNQRWIAAAVANEVAQDAGPVIIMGDFNTTAPSETYDLLAENLIDAHMAAGHGFGFSFPNWRHTANRLALSTGNHIASETPWLDLIPSLVRIDHILVSAHFEPQTAYVVEGYYGSDHRPVVATVQVK